MPTALQLKEQRAQVWGAMTEIMERAQTGELSAEDRAAYDKAEGELTQLTQDVERQERHEANAATFAEVDRRSVIVPGQAAGDASEDRDERPRDEQYRNAFMSFVRSGDQGIPAEERQILQAVDQELRAQSSTPGSAGGYTIPEGFWAKVTEAMKAFGGMASVANILTTDTGAALPWPGNDDTGNVGEQIDENTAVALQDLTFTVKSLGAFIYSSKMVKLPLALLQDTGIDLESYVARKLGERLGRIHNTKQTTGAGGGTTPEGVLTNAVNGKTAAAVAAVTYDELIDLEHSVDPAYRGSGRARFMFNDTTLSALRKVKDSEGRPLWQPSLQAGVADNFNGRPYTINQDMPNLAASAKAIAFGDFHSGYVIRIVKNSTLVRLAERYAESLQVGVFAWNRMDAVPDDTKAYKVLTQAAS